MFSWVKIRTWRKTGGVSRSEDDQVVCGDERKKHWGSTVVTKAQCSKQFN